MAGLNINKFTQASMLSAAFVALSIFCIGIGLGYFGYIDFIVPAFVGIILLKCDLKYTVLSCISSLILIIFVIGNLPAGIMMSQSMILGIVITHFMKKDESIFDDLFFASIASCVIMIFVDINFSFLTGYSFLKESLDYLEMLPPIYDQYKNTVLYGSIACLPAGTVIICYTATVIAAKRFNTAHNIVMKKGGIIRNFKKYGQLISCSRRTIYLGLFLILIVSLMNKYMLIDQHSYMSILFNSIKYIVLFFILQDSVGFINKFIYAVVKSRAKLIICQLLILYCLISFFRAAFIIRIVMNLYFDSKYNLKFKYNQFLNKIQ